MMITIGMTAYAENMSIIDRWSSYARIVTDCVTSDIQGTLATSVEAGRQNDSCSLIVRIERRRDDASSESRL